MSFMFGLCKNLVNLNLSTFNTENVTNISCMFFGCHNLTSLNLSSFDTRKVTNMLGLFYICFNLTKLNLSLQGYWEDWPCLNHCLSGWSLLRK